MKIALGTAQFGLNYGISNSSGQVQAAEATKILGIAGIAGVDVLDTAGAYGDSELVLGRNDTSGFKIVSKLGGEAVDYARADRADNAITEMLKRLGCNHIYGCLVHDPALLLSGQGDVLYSRMAHSRDQGVIQKIGVSAYTPSELRVLIDRYDVDLVQIPLNPLDGRWDEMLSVLLSKEIEVHSRSLFLQGLLLMDPAVLPQYMSVHLDLIRSWHSWCNECGITPLAACIGFINGLDEVDQAVIGVTNGAELEQVLQESEFLLSEPVPHYLRTTDIEFLNPSRWLK